MTVALRVLRAGRGVTLQDGGRQGYLRFGVSWAGPMDAVAHATANHAVGAPRSATAIEISLGGIEATAEGGPLSIGLAGGTFDIRLDGRVLPPCLVTRLDPGSILSVRPGTAGAWCYLAVAGRIDTPTVMGSTATHTRSGLGGIDGREIESGCIVRVTDPVASDSLLEVDARHLERCTERIRVVLGPQDDHFTADQRELFLSRTWTISGRSDRMACLLEGEPLHARSFNIVSDGIVMGAIQVPGDGRPIVLMADRQTTGGYPKIATVIGADLGALAQLRPGARFRFVAVSLSEAVEARRDQQEHLRQPLILRPVVRTDFPSEFLLTQDLIGRVVDDATQ